jgi:hypothetical protein
VLFAKYNWDYEIKRDVMAKTHIMNGRDESLNFKGRGDPEDK